MKPNTKDRHILLFASAGLALVLTFAAAACSRDGQAPVPGPTAEVVDATDAELEVAAKPETLEDVDAAVDASLIVDAGDSTGAFDAADGGSVGLPGLCTADLPMPGDPCSQFGEFRCTNVGASLPPKTPKLKYCYRPNAVQCVKQADGALRYEIMPCAPADPPKLGGPALFACMNWQGVDQCWPTTFSADPKNLVGGTISLGGKPVSIGNAYRCSTEDQIEPCSSSFAQKCTTLAGTGDFAEGIKKAYGDNAKYLEKGLWFLPYLSCHQELVCPCTPPGPGQECQSIFLAKCTTADTGQAHCEENCHDVGAKGY